MGEEPGTRLAERAARAARTSRAVAWRASFPYELDRKSRMCLGTHQGEVSAADVDVRTGGVALAQLDAALRAALIVRPP